MSLYLAAILAPPIVSEEINEIRKELSERYRIFAALKPPVNITLFRPVDYPQELEVNLIKLLKPVCYKHEPFTLNLQNYDSFNIQTLFIGVIKNQSLV